MAQPTDEQLEMVIKWQESARHSKRADRLLGLLGAYLTGHIYIPVDRVTAAIPHLEAALTAMRGDTPTSAEPTTPTENTNG